MYGRSKPAANADRPQEIRCQGPAAQAELWTTLLRERERADRSGLSLSVVVFELGNRPPEDPTVHEFESLLRYRLRGIDAFGWLGDGRLAVILPYTSVEGARLVVTNLSERLSEVPWRHWWIYAYPSESGKGTEPPSTGRGDDASRGTGTPRPTEPVPVPAKAGAVRPLERIFLRSLPTWKRLLDLSAALLLGVASAPIMLLIALGIKLSSRGPVIFTQPRAGLGGEPFKFYKFRTMYTDAEQRKAELRELNEQDGPVFKIKNDPRVTPIGRFLRKSSLDELPQLWNVIKGDMSLVGPRPPTMDETPHYERWQHRRLEVTPGLTGPWQVSGRSLIGFQDWVRMDLRYAERRSLPSDLWILLRTAVAVITARGAA